MCVAKGKCNYWHDTDPWKRILPVLCLLCCGLSQACDVGKSFCLMNIWMCEVRSWSKVKAEVMLRAWVLPAGEWAVYQSDRRWNPQVKTLLCVRLKSRNFQISLHLHTGENVCSTQTGFSPEIWHIFSLGMAYVLFFLLPMLGLPHLKSFIKT